MCTIQCRLYYRKTTDVLPIRWTVCGCNVVCVFLYDSMGCNDRYMCEQALEAIEEGKFSQASDVWAFGECVHLYVNVCLYIAHCFVL